MNLWCRRGNGDNWESAMSFNEAEFLKQQQQLFTIIGQIAIQTEHLNNTMRHCCSKLLQNKGLPGEYAETMLAGTNIENMRRLWIALCKLLFRGNAYATALIDHLARRAEHIIRRRNDVIHSTWYVGDFGDLKF